MIYNRQQNLRSMNCKDRIGQMHIESNSQHFPLAKVMPTECSISFIYLMGVLRSTQERLKNTTVVKCIMAEGNRTVTSLNLKPLEN